MIASVHPKGDHRTGLSTSAYPINSEFFVADDDREEGKAFVASDSYPGSEAQSRKQVNLGSAEALEVALGDYPLATATDAAGNTSEFSFPTTPVCTLELDATYGQGALTLDFLIGMPEPTTWKEWLILLGLPRIIPLWSAEIPAIPDPVSAIPSFPFPHVGLIGFFTVFVIPDSSQVACFHLALVDAGLGVAVPGPTSLGELFPMSSEILSGQ